MNVSVFHFDSAIVYVVSPIITEFSLFLASWPWQRGQVWTNRSKVCGLSEIPAYYHQSIRNKKGNIQTFLPILSYELDVIYPTEGKQIVVEYFLRNSRKDTTEFVETNK